MVVRRRGNHVLITLKKIVDFDRGEGFVREFMAASVTRPGVDGLVAASAPQRKAAAALIDNGAPLIPEIAAREVFKDACPWPRKVATGCGHVHIVSSSQIKTRQSEE